MTQYIISFFIESDLISGFGVPPLVSFRYSFRCSTVYKVYYLPGMASINLNKPPSYILTVLLN